MKGKKAQLSGQVIQMIPRVFFLVVVLLSIVLVVKSFIVTAIDIRKLEADIFTERLLYSKSGIVFYDESLDRSYPGVVDKQKFQSLSKINPNLLDSVFAVKGSENQVLAAKLTLIEKEDPSKGTSVAYYNKDHYDRWEPRTLSTVTGGSAQVGYFMREIPVIIQDGNTINKGKLRLDILTSK
ncbi:MAG: hypothetical protein A2Z88_01195 [Omnitrophica WOR_2 bacterium GWA2_47_8]|nr:MAG: hypothetical protein A2Z88_01195 [Omnitrophica WOR_2 bacterium GWA2_47_8]